MDENQKHHHFLISGEVVFTVGDEINSMRRNGILISDRDDLPVRSLGKAQQILQMQFLSGMGEEAPKTRVVDVLLHSFTYLGHFTKAEFHAAPDGTVLQATKFDTQEAANEPGTEAPAV